MLKSMSTRTNLEKELVRIWEQALQRSPIGVQEDYFELGGTSIEATSIFANIEKTLHKQLPVSLIYEAPTIEQLAASLLLDNSWDRKAYVVPIQTGGEKPALFCVGGGAYWHSVSEHLGPGQPVFGIGLEPEAVEQMEGPNALATLACHMVSALRKRQPEGPYYLCGYCQDGILAYEVARQLSMYGLDVGLLVLIETRNPSPRFRVRAVNGFRRIAMRFAFQSDQLYRLIRSHEFPQYTRARREELNRLLLRASSRVSRRLPLRARRSGRIGLQQVLYFEASGSKLKPLACPTAIFRCTDWPILSAGDPYFGWRELLAGPSEIHEIPGGHEEIFSEPNVRVLAKKLSACLRKARHLETPAYNAVLRDD